MMIRRIRKIADHFLYDWKLTKKFAVAYVIMFSLLAIVLSYTLYHYFSATVLDNSINSELSITKQKANTLNTSLENVTYTADTLITSDYLNRAIQSTSLRTNSTGYELTEYMKSLEDGNLITAIRLYLEDDIYQLLDPDDEHLLSSLNIQGTYWYGRISILDTQLSKVEEGRVTPIKLKNPGKDEIGRLTDSYNEMCEEVNDLLEREKAAADQLKLTEFRALQSQINPHFLYNTLDTINWQAAAGDNERVMETVRTLSSFYRITLSGTDTLVTLRTELQHVSLYMDLINIRFGDSISYLADIPDELLDTMIPKLTLQPLVENSVIHGISELESKSGDITITGWLEGDDVILLLSDTGAGMDQGQLSALFKEPGNAEYALNIGVFNTDKRLRLYFGEGYGLSYESVKGAGTDVRIKIPKRIISEN